jgi:adenylosuccinate lyase
MIERYTRPAMGQIWSEENKLQKWLDVEILACEALAEHGEIPYAAVAKIAELARIDSRRMREIEEEVRHDVAAFVATVAESVGEEGRYVHLGLTSSDVVDTGLAVQLSEAADLLISDLRELLAVLTRQAWRYKDTVMIGRTHGVHAEPITFGLKVAHWYAELKRNLDRLLTARQEISYGKVSGAVGAFANVSPTVEAYVCEKLGLMPEPISTQVVPRDRHAVFFSTLALIATSLERIATEIRHLQQTEVLEVEDAFASGQKGSSSMPHKRNPWQLETVCGLARLVRGYALSALESVPLWYERDISHSSVERVIGPDATILVDFMLSRMTKVLDDFVVRADRMTRNLSLLGGAIFSEHLLLSLVRKGVSREKAYRWVQRNAIKVWEEGADFQTAVCQDLDISRFLSPEEIVTVFDLRQTLRHVDMVFTRVFAGKAEQE